jgi:hypothetical protein
MSVQNRAQRGEPLVVHHGFIVSPSDDASVAELAQQLGGLGRVEQTVWFGVSE